MYIDLNLIRVFKIPMENISLVADKNIINSNPMRLGISIGMAMGTL